MAGRAGIVYSKDYANVDFGPTHPLQGARYVETWNVLQRRGVLSDPAIVHLNPRLATEEETLLAHHSAYLEQVRWLSRAGTGMLSPDTPSFKGMYEYGLLTVGGSIVAVEAVLKGDVSHAMNLAGGFHHASSSRGGGFCIFNDLAVAAKIAAESFHAKRVLVVETDAHHGNGTEEIFDQDPNVVHVSFHEDGRHLYPGTGFVNDIGSGPGEGTKINVPLPPYTGDEAYRLAFDSVLPAVARHFKPDVMLWQCGVDAHCMDPITHMSLRAKTYYQLAQTVHALAHEICGGRLVAFGGGGYDITAQSNCWAIIAATLAEIPVEVPGFEEICIKWEDRDAVPLMIEKTLDQLAGLLPRINIKKRERHNSH